MKSAAGTVLASLFLIAVAAHGALANPDRWKFEWPKTDFTKHSVDFNEILSGGPPKDGIPAIDNPGFFESRGSCPYRGYRTCHRR